MSVRRMGVEEELLLVDPDGHLAEVSGRVLRVEPESDETLEQELFLSQIETSTEPTRDVDELRAALRAGRRHAAESAARAGADVLAVPTPVLAAGAPQVTPKPRYERMMGRFGDVAHEAVVCGMHVHVEVQDDADRVTVVDHARPWLPVILALSANSPFDHGQDTGHASWRAQAWDAWPSAGAGEPFGHIDGYRRIVDDLVTTGAAIDEAQIYFDARLSRSYPTVEFRVADVCTEIEDALVVATLLRALAETALHGPTDETTPWRVELLRAARWRARKDGLGDRLVDPVSGRLVPAHAAVEALVDHVRAALEEAGDLDLVTTGARRLLDAGGGAGRQRAVAGAGLDLSAVVADLRRRTNASWQEVP